MKKTVGKIIIFAFIQWSIPVTLSFFAFREKPEIYVIITAIAAMISLLTVVQHLTVERYLSTLVKEVNNLKEIIKCFRIQRHDFLNHLQIIYSMIQLKKSGEVPDYIRSVAKDISNCSNIFKLKSPEAVVFLFKKYQEMIDSGVKMEITTSPEIENMELVDYHMLEVIDIILNNLVEKVRVLEKEPKISLELLCDGQYLSTVFRCDKKPDLKWDNNFLNEIKKHGGNLISGEENQTGYCIKFTKDTVVATS
jgi:two-component system sensor histidine kinase AgrC